MDGGGSGSVGGRSANILDPAAKEFHPSASSSSSSPSSSSHHLHHNQNLALLTPQIYFPYPSPPPPPPPPPSALPLPLPLPIKPQPLSLPLAQQQQQRQREGVHLSRPAYVCHGPTEALPDAIPTRSLLLSSVPPDVTERLVRMELEVYGGVRAVDMSRLFEEGIVTVHFYDLRSSRSVMDAIRSQHVRRQSRIWNQIQQQQQQQQQYQLNLLPEVAVVGRGLIGGRAVWAQFATEIVMSGSGGGVLDWYNNGSLVVFNLDPTVSSDDLRRVFEPFGAVKETRETPMKPKHKFVEFYDTRDAARALAALNGRELFGKKMSIQFSRPGGNGRSNYCRKSTYIHQSIQLPPRLVGLPRASNSSSISAHLRSGGDGGGESPHPPLSKKNGDGSSSSLRQFVQPNLDRKSQPSSSSSSKHQTNSRQKNSKNRNRSSSEARFVIRGEDNTVVEACGGGSSSSSSSACRDSRTTVMIKNIPNKYSQKLLLNMLDIHCLHCNEQIAAGDAGNDEDREPLSSFDFVYLPIDFNNKCNVGYGFVNMTSPEATWRLYKAFHSRPWEVFNSRKVCQITYARLQGLEALMEHFRNSRFACDNDEYMPVVFSPPRDGNNYTQPSTIGGRSSSLSPDPVDNITSGGMTLLRLSSTISDDPTDGCDSTPPSSQTTLDEGRDEEENFGCGTVITSE